MKKELNNILAFYKKIGGEQVVIEKDFRKWYINIKGKEMYFYCVMQENQKKLTPNAEQKKLIPSAEKEKILYYIHRFTENDIYNILEAQDLTPKRINIINKICENIELQLSGYQDCPHEGTQIFSFQTKKNELFLVTE